MRGAPMPAASGRGMGRPPPGPASEAAMPEPEAAPTPSPHARRLLDRYAEAVRSSHGRRAREELASYIAAVEAENERLRSPAARAGERPARL